MLLNYELSEKEYLEMQQAYRRRLAPKRILFRNLAGLACVVALLGFYLTLAANKWWGVACYLLAAVLFLEHFWLWRRRARKTYRESSEIREPVELRVDPDHLDLTNSSGGEEIRWADILACHETKNLFLLKLSKTRVLTIPRRVLSPGDLFRLKELFRQELIVKSTRENPDVWLMKFVVSWGLIAIVAVSLSLGFIYNFLEGQSRYSRRTGTRGVSTPVNTEKPRVAQVSELRGSGSVYVIPIGTLKTINLPMLTEQFQKKYQLHVNVLPAISAPDWAEDVTRKQYAAEDLVVAMQSAHPDLVADPSAALIGLTELEIYDSGLEWSSATSYRQEERYAVVSSAGLSLDEDDKPVSPEVLQTRVWKLLVKEVGILHYRMQESEDDASVLYRYASDLEAIDDMGSDYLESDAQMRADLHVRSGDACFIVRNGIHADRPAPDRGMVADCSGYYRDGNLETVQIDLRYGLLMTQRTDFFVKDEIPLELTRVLRTQDGRSRAFGVGGNHNLNVFLVGDKWPFTWVDLILEHGGRAHFKRSNWGFGYWDARYTNRDRPGTHYSYSTIDWGWPGWKLDRWGTVYRFADPDWGSRPEQGALTAIEKRNGKRLELVRNADGELLRAHAPGGGELVFQYDSSHRIVRVQLSSGEHVEYSYEPSGHLAKVIDAANRVTEYAYDSSGRMTRVVQDGAEIVALQYDRQGRVESEKLGNGRTYSFQYNQDRGGRVVLVDLSDSAGPMRYVGMSPMDYSVVFGTQRDR